MMKESIPQVSKKSDEVATMLDRLVIKNKLREVSIIYREGRWIYTIEVPLDL